MSLENFWKPQQPDKNIINEELIHMSDDAEDEEGVEHLERSIYPGLINTIEFAKNNPESLDDIYDWYSKAISRRNREPLSEDNFRYHFFEGGSFDSTFMFGDLEDGYVMGFIKYDVFIPTHFAPKSIRSGYNMIKEIGEGKDFPCVMSITEDLVDTVSKLPDWKVLDMGMLGNFRNEIVGKKIVYNNNPDVEKLMIGLVQEYMGTIEK